MQTLERTEELSSVETRKKAPRRGLGFGLIVAAVVVVTAAVSYGLASSRTVTKTVRVAVPEAPKAPAAAAPNCVPGAAPGSCNTDEAAEVPDKRLDAATRAVLAQQLVAARGQHSSIRRWPTRSTPA